MCLVNQVFFDVRIFEILNNIISPGIEIENRLLGSEKKGMYTPSETTLTQFSSPGEAGIQLMRIKES
jgi:hypothetical protein